MPFDMQQKAEKNTTGKQMRESLRTLGGKAPGTRVGILIDWRGESARGGKLLDRYGRSFRDGK